MVSNSLQLTTQRVPIHMVLEIQVLAYDSHVWRGYINSLMGSPTDINKQCKHAQIRYHSKSPHTIIKIWISNTICIGTLCVVSCNELLTITVYTLFL
jgi:hypothetical protein